MDWLKWVVPLIFIAVWILSNLANNQREGQKPTRTPRRRADYDSPPPQSTRPQQSPEEVRRYLEDLRRRRTELEPGRVTARRDAEPPPQAIRPKEPPKLPAAFLDRPAKEPRAGRAEPVPVKVVPAPVVLSVAPTVTGKPVLSPTIAQLYDLLRNRQTLATAFLLREILDRPMSRRPRRRGSR